MKFEGLGHGLSADLLAAANAIVLESGDYKKFFQAALKKFGVTSPAELKGDKEKEFYDYIDKNWDGKDETKEHHSKKGEKPHAHESKIDEDVRDMKNFKNKDRRGHEASLYIETKGKISKDELTVIDKLISKIRKMHVTSFDGASDEPNSLEFYGDEKSLDKFISDRNVQKIVKKYKGKVNGPTKNESVKIEEVLPTPIDGVAESETFNEKAGKYAKYSDLLMQKARLVAQGPVATKEVGDINKKIASEIKKLGIKEDKGFEKILMAAFSEGLDEAKPSKKFIKLGDEKKNLTIEKLNPKKQEQIIDLYNKLMDVKHGSSEFKKMKDQIAKLQSEEVVSESSRDYYKQADALISKHGEEKAFIYKSPKLNKIVKELQKLIKDEVKAGFKDSKKQGETVIKQLQKLEVMGYDENIVMTNKQHSNFKFDGDTAFREDMAKIIMQDVILSYAIFGE